VAESSACKQEEPSDDTLAELARLAGQVCA
jgi:hypothetical protein